VLKGRTVIFDITVKYVPAGGEFEYPPYTGEGETLSMNEMGDVLYLRNLKIRVYPVVGPGLPLGFNQPNFFIFSNGFLG
jgi:hypothetical protein